MIERDEALALASGDGPALDALCRRAAAVRDAAWGRVVTYSRKVFIPLTTYCRDDCGYCAFVRRPGDPGASLLSPDAVLAIARAGQRAGCKEALFSLGEKPELRYAEARAALAAQGHDRLIDYLAAMCALVLRETGLLPHANPGTLDADDIRLLKPVTGSMGMMLESTSRRLTRPGMAHHRCPDKVPVQRLRTLERAGEAGVPFTTGILIGIGETWGERIDALLAIRDAHRRHRHIQEVIVQNFRAKPGTAMADHPEPDHADMLRTIAVARLLLDPEIGVQAPPNLADAFGDYVGAGIKDWGGVSPVTADHINPERAWPLIERLRAATAAAGCSLRERLTVYPAYIASAERHLDRAMREPVRRLAGADGLAAVPA
ncbi:MAG: 7,8-didemethyl-8-hydroxy-5-deazariboflavin synthase CofG [Alphaproteobacteria bacterium]